MKHSQLNTMMHYFIVVVHVTTYLTSVFANKCTKQVNSVFGHRLRYHVIEKTFESDVLQCFQRCRKHGNCYSINYNIDDNMCELSNGNRVVYSRHYERDDRFIYMDHPDKKIQSCMDHKKANPSASSGYYNLQINQVKMVYCDMENPRNEYLGIEVKAYSFGDKSRAPTGSIFSSSYFKVNGKTYSIKRGDLERGHNFCSLAVNGTLVSTARFDSYVYGDSAASFKMAAYINGLPNNTIVMVAVVDTGSSNQNLSKIQAVNPSLHYRQSYAFIGYKGNHKPTWIREVKQRGGAGPSIATTQIPLEL